MVAGTWLGPILAGLALKRVSGMVGDAVEEMERGNDGGSGVVAKKSGNSESGERSSDVPVEQEAVFKKAEELTIQTRVLRVNVLLALLIAIIPQSVVSVLVILQRLEQKARG